jgi:hypothetical protein
MHIVFSNFDTFKFKMLYDFFIPFVFRMFDDYKSFLFDHIVFSNFLLLY